MAVGRPVTHLTKSLLLPFFSTTPSHRGWSLPTFFRRLAATTALPTALSDSAGAGGGGGVASLPPMAAIVMKGRPLFVAAVDGCGDPEAGHGAVEFQDARIMTSLSHSHDSRAL